MPVRAVQAFVRWARDEADQARKAEHYQDVPKEELFARGYIAEQSGHSRGSTVDLTLVDRQTGAVIEQGELTINIPAYQARWAGEPVDLSPNEFRLLRFFAENPDRLLTRRELIEGLGKSEPPIDERTVDVWIGRLRRALKAAGAVDPIRTVRAMGYVFDSY